MLPKDVHIPISETCEHGTVYGKMDFADVIKYLEMRDYPGLSGWDGCSHKCPYKRGQENQSQQ